MDLSMRLKQRQTDTEQLEMIASRFAELGHPTRLAIFIQLIQSGEQGVPVGEIQQQLDIPGSTLSHHIAKLVKVNLIKQIRESRTLFCVPQFSSLMEVINFLQNECCINDNNDGACG